MTDLLLVHRMSPEELQSLATGLHDDHSPAAKLACLILLTDRALMRLEQNTGLSTEPLRDLGFAVVDAYIEREQLSPESLAAALEALQRAGETAKYLRHLPP